MFVLAQTETYFWPVQVETPASGGKFEKHTFDAEFRRIPQSRFQGILDEIKAESTSDVQIAKEVVAGWRNVNDEKGEAVPFTESTFGRLLEVEAMAAAIVMAFFESRAGGKRKN